MTSSKLAIILTSAALLFATPVTAQSPTATDSANTIRDSVKQKVDEELSQIKQAVAKKGFLGSISSISDANITLTSYLGQTRKILVTTDSTIKLSGGKDGTTADLKSGQYILAMGDADSQNTLTAKRILVVTPPDNETRLTVTGAVTKVTSSTLTLDSTDYKITSRTKYTGDTKLSALTAGVKVVLIVDDTTILKVQLVSPSGE